jgi:hypothetical protein
VFTPRGALLPLLSGAKEKIVLEPPFEVICEANATVSSRIKTKIPIAELKDFKKDLKAERRMDS